MIKAIAFDLGRCLIRENDIEMSPQEEILEREFGNINSDEEYFARATQTLSLSKKEVKYIITNLRPRLYSLREEWIFEKILKKYPQMTFAVASNHISMMKESLKHLWILEVCKVILISWDCGYEKPEVWFYQLLLEQLWLSAEEVLFIDDKKENIEGAKKIWLKTIHYRGENLLSESIFSYLDPWISKISSCTT